MENKYVSSGKRTIRRIGRWLLRVLIVSVVVYIFESVMAGLHLDSWEEFSAKTELLDNSILSFSKQVSPVGLYHAWHSNRNKSRYGTYFYKFSSPFNVTKACIAMQKRVFQPPPLSALTIGQRISYQFDSSNSIDSETNDLVPLYYIRNNTWRPQYILNKTLLNKEPQYLQNACSLDIASPDVIDKSFQRSGWEWMLAIPDSIITWMKLNWNYENGDANWPGRIFLVWSLLFAAYASSGSGNEKERSELWKKIIGFVGRLLLSMIFFGLVALLFGGIIWGVLEIGRGIHVVTALLASVTTFGAFIRLYITEAREHLSFQGKEKVAEGFVASFFHFFTKKRK